MRVTYNFIDGKPEGLPRDAVNLDTIPPERGNTIRFGRMQNEDNVLTNEPETVFGPYVVSNVDRYIYFGKMLGDKKVAEVAIVTLASMDDLP